MELQGYKDENNMLNPFSLYFGPLLLLIFYVILIRGTVQLARSTAVKNTRVKLADFIFSGQKGDERGLFYTITIGFPFLITILPWFLDMPSFESTAQLFSALLGAISNYLVVIITVEVGLMYTLKIELEKWRHRLLVVIVLDLMSYVFMALTKTRIELNEKLVTMGASPDRIVHFVPSPYAFGFLVLTGIASFVASLIIVLGVSKLGGIRRP
jgi:hypothetical protein